MDRMENARAVFFLEEDADLSTRPLMLQRVLFCPILAWLRQQLRAEGIGRFFVWYPPESPWTEEFRACFEPEDDVTLSADREVLRTFLREEGHVTVFPDAEIPLRLEGRGYAYRAQASALIEGWLDSPNSSEVRGWEPYGNSTPILSLGDLQAQELAIRDMIVAKHMEKGVREGHINYIAKLAVKCGIDPIDAVCMASYNAARTYGLKRQGAIAPGYRATMVLFDNLRDFNVIDVFAMGKRYTGSICPMSHDLSV